MDEFLRFISSSRESAVDYRVASLPFMSTNTWTLAAVASAYVAAVLFLFPSSLKQRSLPDMRPLMLIFYGFQFGIHGIGVLLFFLTNDLSTSWSCARVNQSATDVKTMGLIYSTYVFLIVKVVGLLEPVLQLAMGGASFPRDPNVTGLATRLLSFIYLAMAAMKTNPGHSFLWIAMSDMMVESVYYGYRALTSASSEMLPDPKWKKAISMLRVVQALSLLSHGLYLSSHRRCFMPKSVAFAECVHALLVLTLEALDFVRSHVRDSSRLKHL